MDTSSEQFVSLSKITLSIGQAILYPTASSRVNTSVVGLQSEATELSADLTTIATALGPIGIRPILYFGSSEQNSPSPTTTSSDSIQSSICTLTPTLNPPLLSDASASSLFF